MKMQQPTTSPRMFDLGHRQKSAFFARFTLIVPPGKHQLTGFPGDDMEDEIRIRRDRRMQFHAKHFPSAVGAGEGFDNVPRDRFADIIEAKAGLHRVIGERENFDHLSALRGGWYANF